MLIDIPVLLWADFRLVNRFSNQTDVHEKAAIIVDELRKVKDE